MKSTAQAQIFIVEDNFLYSYVLEEMLKEHGNYKVRTFATAEDAIESLKNNPDLIILDYNLANGMNGIAALKIIKEKNPKIPVIVLSSQSDTAVAAELLSLGVYDYIQKKDGEMAMIQLLASVLKALKK